jgi:predicted ArsR family transcriptional regulator
MPRYRGTSEAAASLVGQLLLLIAQGHETSASLASRLGISSRQVNRYIRQLINSGWQISRMGTPTKGAYWFELESPRVTLPDEHSTKRLNIGPKQGPSFFAQ